jgi:predicted  nucleic acid-binding Zn-ribbon protein
MHRAAYHFIKALGIPSLTKRKHKRRADLDEDEVANGSDAENEEDDEADVDVSMDIEADADDADAMAETMVVDFELGDTIGKLLAFVNQVRVSSEGVREYLAHCCRLQEVKPIELLLWVRSRWGSLSHCLGTVLVVQKVH